MGRKAYVTKEEVDSGYLTCKNCNKRRELIYFNKDRYKSKSSTLEYTYKVGKCKVCISPYGEDMKPRMINSNSKLDIVSDNIKLSQECKNLIKRIIYMRGYIDVIEAYKLAHYHLETFGYIEREIITIEDDIVIMFKELLQIYRKEEDTI